MAALSLDRQKARGIGCGTGLVLITLVLFIPILWMIMLSLKTEGEYSQSALQLLPAVPQWDNYWDALTKIDFAKFMLNSLVLSLLYTVPTVITSSMAGFAFASLEGPGKRLYFGVIIAMLMIPAIVFIIPQFVIFARLRLTGTYWPWFLWGISGNAFHIFLFRQFFAGFPKELQEAAEADGASIARFFVQILLPNAKPALATSFILSFAYVWGDWFLPTIYLNADNTNLAAMLLNGYRNPQGFTITTVTMAAAALYVLPLVIMFFLMQRWIMEGIATSGLKG
ncbi:MAG: carbohydrate ABC transporter permease [Chloroflexota bacterium]|nr:carbohydrate ABC transporter permease [Chloroflexota bacterium]MDE2856299.1 carbohydrate ABC transporter permease [Chloroflexota bacterium]MDE2950942.1 carbohydrate ABC transporter permease [Chloroflexota bacterium]